MPASPKSVNPADLRPFASFAVLEFTGADQSLAIRSISYRLRQMALRQASTREASVLAEGIDDNWLPSVIDAEEDEALAVYALATHVVRVPSWAVKGSGYTSTSDELSVAFQRNGLVAVHCPSNQVDALQRWLDGNPKPGFRRVDGSVLQQAFLQGEARGLWLRGTHRRRATKADTKNLTGVSLANALDPFEDSSFALTSGRAAVDAARGLRAIDGIVGTTPRKSWMWNSRTDSLADFVSIAREALVLVDALRATPAADLPFPELAVELKSFSGVSTAFDAYLSEPEELAQLPDVSKDTLDRAEALSGSLLEVIGSPSGPTFTLSVGDRGAETGRLRVKPEFVGNRVRFDYRIEGSPSHAARTAEIRDLLSNDSGELLNVYFESGHALTKGTLTTINLSHSAFKGWRFHDFSGYDIDCEKPAGVTAQEIHDAIGTPGDSSLFGWLTATLGPGHLTCDDGANEVADFVHVDHGGLLTLIHIKASSPSPTRRVAAGAFELVVSQASKNLSYLQPMRLMRALESAGVGQPAAWLDGARVPDRSQILAALRARPASAESLVVIVQPHHRQSLDMSLRSLASSGGSSQDLLRLQLIETMLNSTRGSAVGAGADLEVWSSL